MRRTATPSRRDRVCKVHIVGPRGDLVDDGGHFRDAYGLLPGEWVLVRPDGYVGAIVAGDEFRSSSDIWRKWAFRRLSEQGRNCRRRRPLSNRRRSKDCATGDGRLKVEAGRR